MASAQGVRYIPAHTHENDLLWEMGTLIAIVALPPFRFPAVIEK